MIRQIQSPKIKYKQEFIEMRELLTPDFILRHIKTGELNLPLPWYPGALGTEDKARALPSQGIPQKTPSMAIQQLWPQRKDELGIDPHSPCLKDRKKITAY